MKEIVTLLEFSNIAVKAGYPDLFDFDVERDILNIDRMEGSLADYEGCKVICFRIVEIYDGAENNNHLDTLIVYDTDDL